jgi:hypothetical protein
VGGGVNVNPMLLPTVGVAAALFWVGRKARGRTRAASAAAGWVLVGLGLTVPAALYAAYYGHWFDRAAWFYQLRSLRGSELLAGGVGFLAGYGQAWIGKTRALKVIGASGLPMIAVVLVAIPYLKPMLLPLDTSQMQDRWQDKVCRQSTPSTCGPSCVATILKVYGIAGTEREIARECFTCATGTENWYMARALRRRGLKARFVVTDPQAEPPGYPAIAGWDQATMGVGHFVTLLAPAEEGHVIGDPVRGRIVVTEAEIKRGYFSGFYLVASKKP